MLDGRLRRFIEILKLIHGEFLLLGVWATIRGGELGKKERSLEAGAIEAHDVAVAARCVITRFVVISINEFLFIMVKRRRGRIAQARADGPKMKRDEERHPQKPTRTEKEVRGL